MAMQSLGGGISPLIIAPMVSTINNRTRPSVWTERNDACIIMTDNLSRRCVKVEQR
jgi:hypothetical protein